MNGRGRAALVPLVCGFLVVVSFRPAFGLFRFHDDWTFVYRAADAVMADRVTAFILSPLDQHWSPLWHTIEVVNFLVAGWESDWFIRALIATCTLLSLLLCASFLQTLGVSTMAWIVGVATLALHHSAAAARFSFDTCSQAAADLLGWTAVVFAIRGLLRDRGPSTKTIVAVLALLTAAILMKEQALGAFAGIALAALWTAWRRSDGRSSPRTWWLLALLIVEVAFFAIVRDALGVRFRPSGEPFGLCIPCVPVNIAQLTAAVLIPVRTLTFFDAIRAMPVHLATVVWSMVGALVVGGALAIGLVLWTRRHREQGAVIGVISCALLASYFPVALLGHVGELYTHPLLFWFAVVVAISVDAVWTTPRPGWRAAVAACAVAYIASLAIGQRANLREMRATGDRARLWLTRIGEALQSVPDGSLVVIRAETPYKPLLDYGLYRLTTPNTLVLTGLSPWSIRYVTDGRMDVVLDQADAATWLERINTAISAGRAYRLNVGADEQLRVAVLSRGATGTAP